MGTRSQAMPMLKCMLALALVAVACVSALELGEQEYPIPIGEDDEAENSLQARVPPAADVFLSASVGAQEEDDAPAKAKAKAVTKDSPLITLDGGGEFHVGPQAIVKTSGGAVQVKKGSKLAVSQRAKLISQ